MYEKNIMKKNVNAMTFVMMLCVSLILVGCGTTTTTTNTAEPAQKTVISKSADGSVEVLEISSSRISYNGEHKGQVGTTRGRHVDHITTTLTLDSNNIITAVSNTHEASSPKSDDYQSRFESAISSKIVGKNIKDLDISVVGGASTTSEAFNAALDSIRTQISGS